MFTLAKSRLVGFRFMQPRRIAPRLCELVFHEDILSKNSHSNDNLPGFRHPAAKGKRGSPPPALACHWFTHNGRLECCWVIENSSDVQIDDVDEYACAQSGVISRLPKQPQRLGLAPAG